MLRPTSLLWLVTIAALLHRPIKLFFFLCLADGEKKKQEEARSDSQGNKKKRPARPKSKGSKEQRNKKKQKEVRRSKKPRTHTHTHKKKLCQLLPHPTQPNHPNHSSQSQHQQQQQQLRGWDSSTNHRLAFGTSSALGPISSACLHQGKPRVCSLQVKSPTHTRKGSLSGSLRWLFRFLRFPSAR